MSTHFLTNINHIHLDSTDSTNSQLITHIKDGHLLHDSFYLFTADHQSAGRGQHGRTWVSDKGNVFLSLYVPMGTGEFELHQLSGLLSLVVGLELSQLDFIRTINTTRQNKNLPTVGVKWANDVGFYDECTQMFCKLAGILIEPVFKKLDKNTLVGVVIGIGLNANHAPIIKDGLYLATCLKALDDSLNVNILELYIKIANAILSSVWQCNAFFDPDYLCRFITFFNKHHLLHHQPVQIFIQNDMHTVNAQGKCVGIGKDGELLLKNNDTITPIFAGMAQIKKEL